MIAAQRLTASLEDYLEAIFHISGKNQVARAKDIAGRLGVNSSSVTGALHTLSDRKLINYEPYGLVTLTAEGKAAAEGVVRRHSALRDFFVKVLGIEESEAEEGACKIEHVVSRTILERLTQFVRFVEACPWGGADWNADLGYFCKHGATRENCDRCMNARLQDAD